jgi:phage gp29-like protein
MAVTLYDAYGRPVRTRELTREIAAPTLTGIRSVWNETVAGGLTPQRLAALLRNANDGDAHEYLTLAEEMEERDPHYACELGKRKLAVSRLPVTVEAFSDEKKDVEMADAVRALARKPGFRGLVKSLLDGIGKGYSVVEIIWDRSGAKWYPARYEWRDPRFFTFDRTTRRQARLLDEAGSFEGLPLQPCKFLVHAPSLKTGLPIRGGLARLAAWAYLFKNYTLKDWMAFAEVYGMPLRIGKYGPSATEAEIDILKTAVAGLGSDAAAVIPESMLVDLVEAQKNGSIDVYLTLAEYLDAQVSKGILGQTASSSGTPGKLGDEKLQSEVRDDIRDDDAGQLAETLNRDLVKPFIDLNFGTQENYPELRLMEPDTEDVAALVDALDKLVPLGLKVEQSVIRDKLGLPDPDPKAAPEELLGNRPSPALPLQGRAGSAQAANREGETREEAAVIPALVDRLGKAASPRTDAWIDTLKKRIDEAGSLEELPEIILAAYPEMSVEALAGVIAEETMRAFMAGRIEAELSPGKGSGEGL